MQLLDFDKLKSMNRKELINEKRKAESELFKLNLLKRVNPIKDTSQFKKLRRYIARINFLLHTK
ncbi:MAG: 50S ribosomal protein L29 [bacterium]|nr:50S ribosomal protein L29 [bacterium]